MTMLNLLFVLLWCLPHHANAQPVIQEQAIGLTGGYWNLDSYWIEPSSETLEEEDVVDPKDPNLQLRPPYDVEVMSVPTSQHSTERCLVHDRKSNLPTRVKRPSL